jgi:putative oxidoreductase
LASIAIVLFTRLLLVALFLPFSALDKVVNFKAAVGQAGKGVSKPVFATSLIVIGFTVEVLMSLAIVTGIADRLAAFILAGYCGVTALLWKQFWTRPDFRLVGPSQGREVFWDFLKNLAVAGGFLLLAFGTDSAGVQRFFLDPLASSHPYAVRTVGTNG